MKNVMLLLTATVLSGCELLAPQIDQTAEEVGEGVSWYCRNLTPDVRQHFRQRVNEYASPNTITVTCTVDGSVLTTVFEGFPSE